ncbi:MAG: hypothetical protein BWY82_02818 [Verrucomicrobia bacterium ADurb.Bin474]|nr:MAG: hypothetical protein BWY82_02818 [Verrucomicrobia bacterium ADurb.Bin474]
MFPEDLVGQAHPVGTHYLTGFMVPHENVIIVIIKVVQIARTTGSFSDLPERDFAQPPDLAHDVRDLGALGQIDAEASVLRQFRIRPQCLQVLFEFFNRDSINDGLIRGLG